MFKKKEKKPDYHHIHELEVELGFDTDDTKPEKRLTVSEGTMSVVTVYGASASTLQTLYVAPAGMKLRKVQIYGPNGKLL